MKKILITAIMMLIVFGVSGQAKADLTLLGQGLGHGPLGDYGTYNLVYDTDLDITWFTFSNSPDTWDNQVAWASALSVTFGSNLYTDWRLPTTVDGPSVYGYDGTTTAGYNITSSEMGHLDYTELGNSGYYDTSGNVTGCYKNDFTWHCLSNTGDFQGLLPSIYWSGTEYSTDPAEAWYFEYDVGNQNTLTKGATMYAMAVRDGLAVVPEPMSMVLFAAGGVVMAARRKLMRRRNVRKA
jgi:hypothetical protein